MNYKNIYPIFISILMVSCGGSNTTDIKLNTTNSQPNQSSIAYFVDSAVQGVDYVCGSFSGETDLNGMFKFEQNKDCLFSIGAITFSLDKNTLMNKKQSFITPYDIYQSNQTLAINLARVLQTLDSDNNLDNGIQISSVTKNSIKYPIIFSSNEALFTEQFTKNSAKNIIDYTSAKIHLDNTIAKLSLNSSSISSTQSSFSSSQSSSSSSNQPSSETSSSSSSSESSESSLSSDSSSSSSSSSLESSESSQSNSSSTSSTISSSSSSTLISSSSSINSSSNLPNFGNSENSSSFSSELSSSSQSSEQSTISNSSSSSSITSSVNSSSNLPNFGG
ncbi:MAG: hypothetical protein HXX81_00005 [Campylobacterales bacterium]|nr:hypothetical protein [Campylobacterales bacterium]